MIYDEGPHYRLLVDITYLDNTFYKGKTTVFDVVLPPNY